MFIAQNDFASSFSSQYAVRLKPRRQNSLTPMELSGADVLTQLNEDKQRYAELVGQYDLDLRNAG